MPIHPVVAADHFSLLLGINGTVATILICALLFIDEAGVPLPFAPNEILLIAAGLLIGGGGLSPFIFFPLAFLAMGGGVAAGYGWARALGPTQLRKMADRLRAAKHYDRAVRRLRDTNALGIFVARMLPGVRVYATLVSGATEFPRRRFLAGALPAMVVWCVFFTMIGVVVGKPAEAYYFRVERFLVSGGLFIALGVAGFLAARHVPPSEERSGLLTPLPRASRYAIALAIDLGAVASIVIGVERIARFVIHQHPDGRNDVALLITAVLLAYIVISRRGPGGTVGEQLMEVTYRKVSLR
ncbi:MAG: DedA family protein, partial [Candidatus Dormibacteria bacterium]